MNKLRGKYNLKIGIELDTTQISKQLESVLKNVKPIAIDTQLSNKITEQFGVKKLQDIQAIIKSIEEYKKALSQNNEENISKTFENVKISVVDAMTKIKKEVTDAQQIYSEFLKYVQNSKIYIPTTDRGDNYNENRMSIGASVIVSKKNAQSEINSWYQEASDLFPAILKKDIEVAEDQFNRLASAVKQSREIISQNKFTESDILELFGGENGLHNAINDIVSSINDGVEKVSQAMSAFGDKIDLSKLGLNAEDIKNSPAETIDSLVTAIVKADDKLQGMTLTSREAFSDAGDELIKYTYQIEDASGAITQFTANLSSGEIFTHTQNISQATDSLSKLSDKTENASTNTFEYARNVNSAGQEMKSAEKHSNSFVESLKKIAMQYVSIRTMFNFFKSGINSVVELNKAMTNLQMVTGWSNEAAKENVMLYNQYAKALGVSTQAVMEGADAWLRQGKSIEETNQLIQASTMFARVAKISTSESTEILTAALNSYNLEAKDAVRITDMFNAVDAVAATSAKELGVAYQYVAAAAGQAGISQEKLTGLLAVGSEKTRLSAEQIGNTWRTLIARMQNVKVGKFIDDETGEDLNDILKVLSKVNIEVVNSSGIWRDFGDVFDDIGKKWHKFDQTQQNAISTALAGTRAANIFRSTMESYDNVLEYTNVAQQSAGTTLEKFGTITDSIDFKINAFKESLVGMWENAIDTEFIKGVVDLGTGIISLIDLVGGLNNAVLLAGGYFIALNFQSVIAGFKGIGDNVNAAGGGIKGFISALLQHNQAAKLAKAENISLSAAYQQLGFSAAATQLAITGVMVALTAGILIYNNWKQSQEKALQSALEINREMKNQITTIDELKAKIQDERLSREELISVLSNHNKSYESELENISDINELRKKSIDLIDEEGKKRAEEAVRQTSGEYVKAKEYISRSGGYGTPQNELDYYASKIDEINEKINQKEILSKRDQQTLEHYSKLYTELSKKIENATLVIEGHELNLSILNGTYQSTADTTTEATESTDDFITSTKELTSLSQIIAGLTNELTLLDTVQQNFGKNLDLTDEGIKELEKSVSKLKDTYPLLYDALIKYNIAQTDENKQLVLSTLNHYQEIEAAKQAGKSYEDNISTLKNLYSIQKDNNDLKELTYFQILDLITQYPELASAIKITETGFLLESNALERLIELRKEDIRLQLEQQKVAIAGAYRETAGVNVENTIRNLSEKINAGIITSGEEYVRALEETGGRVINGTKEFIDSMIANGVALELLNKDVESFFINSSSSKSKSTQKLLDTNNQFEAIIKDLEKRLDPINREIEKIQSQISKAEAMGDTDLVNSLTSELIKAQRQRKTTLEQMLADTQNITSQINSTFREFANVDMSDYGIAKYRQNLSNQITSLQNANADNVNDAQIKSLESTLSRFNEFVGAYQAGQQQLNNIQSQIDKSADQIFDTTLKKSDTEIQAIFDEYLKQWEQRAISEEEFIANLESLLNRTMSGNMRDKITTEFQNFFDNEYARNKTALAKAKNLLLPDDFEGQLKNAMDNVKNAEAAIAKARADGFKEGSALMDSLQADLSSDWTNYYDIQLKAAQDALMKTGDNSKYQETLNNLLKDGNAELINKLSIINALDESSQGYYKTVLDNMNRELDLYKKNAGFDADPLQIIEYLDNIKSKSNEAANALREELLSKGWDKELIEFHPDIINYSNIQWSAEDEQKAQRRNAAFAEFDLATKTTSIALGELDRQWSQLSDTDLDSKSALIAEKIKLQEAEVARIIPQFDILRQLYDKGDMSAEDFADETDKLTKSLFDNTKAINENKIAQANLNQDIALSKNADAMEEFNFQMKLLADNDYDGKLSLIAQQLNMTRNNIDINSQKMRTLNDLFANGEIKLYQYEAAMKEVTKAWRDGVVEANNLEKQTAELQKQMADEKAREVQKIYDGKKKAATDAINAEIKKFEELGKQYDESIKQLDNRIAKLKEELDVLNKQKDLYDKALSAVYDVIDGEIKALEDQKKALQDSNKEIERQIELEELQEKLRQARQNKTVRIFKEGIGWVYEADQKAIQEAQKAIDDFNFQSTLNEIDKQIEGWQKYRDSWEETVRHFEREQNKIIATQILGANWESQIIAQRTDIIQQFGDHYYQICDQIENGVQRQIAALEQEKANLEEHKKVLTETVEQDIANLKLLLEEWQNAFKGIDDSIIEYQGSITDLIGFEGQSYATRLENLKTFVSQYLAEMNKINAMVMTPVSSDSTYKPNFGLDYGGGGSYSSGGEIDNVVQGSSVSGHVGEPGYPTMGESKTIINQMKANSEKWWEYEEMINSGLLSEISGVFTGPFGTVAQYKKLQDDLHKENEKLAEQLGKYNVYYDEITGTWNYDPRYNEGRVYAKGGVADYTGIAQIDGTPTSSEVIFNATDAKKLYKLVHTTDDLSADIKETVSDLKQIVHNGQIYTKIDMPDIFKNFTNTAAFKDTSRNIMQEHYRSIMKDVNMINPMVVEKEQSFTVGDVHIHNPVSDSEDLANSLLTRFPNTMLQKSFKR